MAHCSDCHPSHDRGQPPEHPAGRVHRWYVPVRNNPIQTHYSPGEITRLSKIAEQTATASLSAIVKIPVDESTFDNTVIAFDGIMTEYADAVNPLILMGNVYPDAGIAAEGMSCEESASVFDTTVYTRRDLYDALREQTPRTPEESRLYDVTIREFEKNGLKLSEESLAKVREMKTELSGLETRFSANLNNDATTFAFTAGEHWRGFPHHQWPRSHRLPKVHIWLP